MSIKNQLVQLKYSWMHNKYMRSILHWTWIAGCMGLLCWSISHWMNSVPETHPRLSLTIKDPHFYSISKAGNPYHIYSKSIQFKSSEYVSFFQPWAEFQMTRQKIILSGQYGLWNDRSNILTLRKEVCVRDNHDQHIRTDFAKVLYKQKKISSNRPTYGSSPKGCFCAHRGFSWTEKELHLTGPVTMVLRAENSKK
jgi:hypothetical protein